MRKIIFSLVILCLIVGGIFLVLKNKKTFQKQPPGPAANSLPMKITSSAFADQQNIPAKYTCDGDGVNPPLSFGDIPNNAVTLALIMEDPDAPKGTWMHWVMWNIPPQTKEIAENSVPAGAVQGQGSSGLNIYGGPCPPSGVHHYIFNLYALDGKITIPSYSTADKLREAMAGHIIASSQLTGLYSRNR